MWSILISVAVTGAVLVPEGCKNVTLCGQLPWSEWTACSQSCGGGSQIRKREICGLPEWGEEEVEDRCGKPLRIEHRVCNAVCLNDGMFADDTCICKPGKTGICCENDLTSLDSLTTSKEQAFSFLRKSGSRSKRDDHIDEECRETRTCDHEEVREWIDIKHIHKSVCQWMKDRRCGERSCGAGYRCYTIIGDCSRYSHYHVGCTDINECNSNPCWNGGTCNNYVNRFTCSCPDEYYGTRCEHVCTKPANCHHQRCTTRDDYVCTKCDDQGASPEHSIYYTSPNRKQCEATCSWKQNWCWPGTCGDHLAKNCVCSEGFSLSSSDSHKICNLKVEPDLLTCRVGVQNSGGEVRNSTSVGPCLQEKANYMKFQPAELSFEFTFSSTVNVSTPKPKHIQEFHFGIVNSSISVSKRNVLGHTKNMESVNPKQTKSCTLNSYTDISPLSTLITCKMSIGIKWSLQDGEHLCLEFIAYAGGYLKTLDFSRRISSPHLYRSTKSSHEVCMIRDSSAPKHCLEDNSCRNNERILFENRITKTADIGLTLKGWFDPFLHNPDQASGIKSYTITIHDTKEKDASTLMMDESSLLNLNVTSDVQTIKLPDKQPALYGVSLGILDNAGNFKQARRFVLFDNSSKILINPTNVLKVSTGSFATNYTWQTNHGKICVNWRKRYYNSYNIHYNLLRKIQADYHNLYNGVYEQHTGQLPVNGTLNVDGIIDFRYAVTLNDIELENYPVPNFMNQSICINYNVRDGETYTFSIIPVDIMNNTIKETIAIHIDASVPDINDIYLIKDGVRQLFVHNSTDLSKMTISFEALDEHSGLYSIEWMLGTTLGGKDLGRGTLAVNRLQLGESCNQTDQCYCPKVGVCEKSVYDLKFNSLIKNNTQNGHHNREYFFTVKVTNNARLVSISRTDILADDSPPETGFAREGEIGSPEIDYTSRNDTFLRWGGFIDHESGIKKYRIGFSEKCLSREDLLHNSHNALPSYIYETVNEYIKVQIPSPGVYFTSVIAYNYALQPSDVACSNGIIYDVTPPKLHNVMLEQAKTREFVGCYNNSTWLILQNLSSISLQWTKACEHVCNGTDNEFPLVDNLFHLPDVNFNDSSYADTICRKVNVYHENEVTYIPSDTISLTWNVTDPESQIHDIQIGLASTKSQFIAPDILSFRSTKRMQSDKRFHSTLGSGIPFFIIIKATSKAGLETSVVIGPVVIDDTPPLYTGSVKVIVDQKFLFVVWNNETFVDEEQIQPISTVLFKIGHGSTFKTPILQGYQSNYCPGFGKEHTCLKYPIDRVQRLNDDGTPFFFELYFYNIVGHATTVRTDEFSVPSRYPPTPGTVLDISKQFSNLEDLDYIASDDTVCVALSGFKHHETVTFEVAFGSNNTDDLMKFRSLPTNRCFHNVSLPENTRIYTLVRATSSGGSSLSTSDGFVVIDKSKAAESVRVFDGTPCNSLIPEFRSTVMLTGRNVEIKVENKSLTTEKYFALQIIGMTPDSYSVASADAIWTGHPSILGNVMRRFFLPMVENPTFYINTMKQFNTNLHFEIIACNENAPFQIDPKSYKAYWTIASPYKRLVTYYRSGLLLQRGPTENLVVPLTIRPSTGNINFRDIHLLDGGHYKAIVQPCFEKICTKPLESIGSIIEYKGPSPNKVQSLLKQSTDDFFDLLLKFNGFECSDMSYAIGYTVAIQDKNTALITEWMTDNLTPLNIFNVSIHLRNISLPEYSQHQLSVCVRGFCFSGKSTISCQLINEKESISNYESNILYEVNADILDMTEIKSFVHSRYLGDKMSVLHNHELNFIRPDWKINGVLIDTFGRKINWYIMNEKRLPQKTCAGDYACIQEAFSEAGVGYFKRMRFTENKKYYVCAFSNETIIKYEKTFEEKSQIALCGNGFVVDDTPPLPGSVRITADFGYFVNSNNSLSLEWKGFTDIEKEVMIEYPSGIERYSYSIGTYPGGEDLVSFTDAGKLTYATVSNVMLKPHIVYYATVRAMDRVGLFTEVSSEGVMYDNTPPLPGSIAVGWTGSNKYVSSYRDVFVTWNEFSDPESGIKSFEIGLGSSPVSADVFTMTEVEGTSWKVEEDFGKFIDGYEYYVLLLVTNNAGLTILENSEPFIIDGSPPSTGFVMDGNETGIEVDFQLNITHICSRWYGFHDPHTDIAYYEIGIGTMMGKFDVFPATSAGLTIEYCWVSDFIPGTKYFTTVRACNQAGLCTSKSSDGVILDNSPPVPGLVHVGMSDRHQHYISHKNSVTAQWIGFQDPHSDLDHFEWCISRNNDMCDITGFENVLLTGRMTKASVNLPENTDLYVLVRAYNRVGLYTQRSSESFRVDTTPPVEEIAPFIDSSQFSHRQGTQYDNSVLTARWKFTERDSFIISNEVILKSHNNGKTIKDIYTQGNENNITIKLDDKDILKSGDSYSVQISSCNAAGLCTHGISNYVAIDSSPPQLGSFKNTMKWRNYANTTELLLLWYGFTDIHTGIEKYGISVSNSYTGTELSDGTVYTNHVDSETQTLSLNLTRELSETEEIILSVFALNKAGLRSKISKMTVTMVSDDITHAKGFFKIQRYLCRTHTCNNDCTCSVIGHKCNSASSSNACTRRKDESEINFVRFGYAMSPANLSTSLSSACVFAQWTVKDLAKIQRFEWSIGVYQEYPGAGVFDRNTENVWKENGHLTNTTFCTKKGKHFSHGEFYVFYVRGWLSGDTYIDKQSSPLLIDTTAPTIRRGKSIKETIFKCSENDIDILDSTYDFLVCWDNVFSESGGTIEKYAISAGTSPFGNDLFDSHNVGLSTTFPVEGKSIEPGVTFYFTITATNNIGMKSSFASDGILVDLDNPVGGVVYNTEYHRNAIYQSSTNEVALSWHGFDDHHSFIKDYKVILTEKDNNDTLDISIDAKIRNTYRYSGLDLKHAATYKVALVAYDAAGHWIGPIYAKDIQIDTTPPEGLRCTQLEVIPMDIVNKSHSDLHKKTRIKYQGSTYLKAETFYRLTIMSDVRVPSRYVHVHIGNMKTALYLFDLANGSAHAEHSFVSKHSGFANITATFTSSGLPDSFTIRLYQCLTYETTTQPIILSQLSARSVRVSMQIQDIESGIKSIHIGAGTTKSGYQIRPLLPFTTGFQEIIDIEVPHNSSVYVTAIATNHADMESTFHSSAIVIDHTAPEIFNVNVNIKYEDHPILNINSSGQPDNKSEVTGNRTLTTIQVAWEIMDNESKIRECECGAGPFPHSTSLVPWERSVTTTSCFLPSLNLQHGAKLHITIRCTNGVHLRGTKSHGPITISFKYPEIRAAKIDFLPSNAISVEHSSPVILSQSNKSRVTFSWNGFIDSSGIREYETRLWKKNKVISPWQKVGLKTCTSIDIHGTDGDTYTVQVKAINYGGLESEPTNSSIMTDARSPRLTGNSVGVKKSSTDEYIIDWSNVFQDTIKGPTAFVVSIGSSRGYSDLVSPFYTLDHSISIDINNASVIYVDINAVCPTGESLAYHAVHSIKFW